MRRMRTNEKQRQHLRVSIDKRIAGEFVALLDQHMLSGHAWSQCTLSFRWYRGRNVVLESPSCGLNFSL